MRADRHFNSVLAVEHLLLFLGRFILFPVNPKLKFLSPQTSLCPQTMGIKETAGGWGVRKGVCIF